MMNKSPSSASALSQRWGPSGLSSTSTKCSPKVRVPPGHAVPPRTELALKMKTLAASATPNPHLTACRGDSRGRYISTQHQRGHLAITHTCCSSSNPLEVRLGERTFTAAATRQTSICEVTRSEGSGYRSTGWTKSTAETSEERDGELGGDQQRREQSRKAIRVEAESRWDTRDAEERS